MMPQGRTRSDADEIVVLFLQLVVAINVLHLPVLRLCNLLLDGTDVFGAVRPLALAVPRQLREGGESKNRCERAHETSVTS
jgi:hypothetical protein